MNRMNFINQRKLTSRTRRAAKRNYDKRELEEIEADFQRTNTRKFYQTFKKIVKGYQAPSLNFKNKKGELIQQL